MKRRALFIVLFCALLVVATVIDGACQQKGGAEKTPLRGGTLREIAANGPRVLSYPPEMGPVDGQAIMVGVEKLMEYNQARELVPFLAESVTVAKDLKSITFKLKKGIKFHDGSDLNTQAVAWNYQLEKDTKRLQFYEQAFGDRGG